MYFPYLRGKQFGLPALRELADLPLNPEKNIPIIKPVKNYLSVKIDGFSWCGNLKLRFDSPSTGNKKERPIKMTGLNSLTWLRYQRQEALPSFTLQR
ncbi:MAG: hypothetical protein QHC79_14950 [Pseudosphingobacterium sp.]|nr:hypothetical protein [Pseudosphingobacterium sp.]